MRRHRWEQGWLRCLVLQHWSCQAGTRVPGKELGRAERRNVAMVRLEAQPYCHQHCSPPAAARPSSTAGADTAVGAWSPRPGSVLTHVGAGWGQPRAHSCCPALPAASRARSPAQIDGEELSVPDGSRHSTQAELCRAPKPERCGQQGPWLLHSSRYQNL